MPPHTLPPQTTETPSNPDLQHQSIINIILLESIPDLYFPFVFLPQFPEGTHSPSSSVEIIENTYIPQPAQRYSHTDHYEVDFSYPPDPSKYSQ